MNSWIKNILRRGEVDCNDVRRLSSDYLDDDLPEVKHSAIRTHLSNCGPCRAFVETLASTIGILSRLPRVSAPSSLKESVMNRIKRGD